ncbi:S-phase kinase-associated protein 2-like [Mytilus californianus]|uniref:S-phase kinase-associated protein 2-like n=1 Tax=Mytilus californianus TaxID=6549 RepID=UPI002245F65A|nr:S-phase kinase-associated protein 2-like [Mytilus californianus]
MGKTKQPKKYSEENSKENKKTKQRKKKLTDENDGRVHIKWAVSQDQTERLYSELGVENISDESSDSCYALELTPAVTVNKDKPVAPCAPRILLPSQKPNLNHSYTSDDVELISPLSTPNNKKFLHYCHDDNDDDVDEDSQYDYFAELSDEVILNIFKWLPRFTLAKCARVCHRWSRLVADDHLWKRIDLSNRTLSPGVLGNVLRRGVQILRLAKSEIEGPVFICSPKVLSFTRLSRVQYLDLSMASITTPILQELLSVCTHLKKLSLEHCPLNDEICRYIAENKNLEVINMSMCQGITVNGLMPICNNCTRLESLNVAWTGIHRHSVVYLSLCLPQSIEKLNISGCRENITDEEILQLVKRCYRLRELDLSDSTVITCNSIRYLTQHLKRLEYIALSRCYRISPTTIPELQNILSLNVVDVFGMLRNQALQQLRQAISVDVNKYPFSSIARPTTGVRRTSIWGIPVRDNIL